jgi:serine/threonine-protein kinase HipA
MNLPEGDLRERLTRRFAKATGTFDEIDLLAIVGRSQIGRLRYSGMDEDLSEDVPFQSIDEILRAKRGGGLFNYLLEQFATHSGLSGVQPKVLIRARAAKPSDPKGRQSPTIQSATHIVKLWDESEYPELAANEFFCLAVAKRVGLTVPKFALSDDGGALVIDRFDLVDGRYLGFEDFCVLNGFGTKDKYKGGYESRVFKRLRDFVAPQEAPAALEELFKLFVVNCALRNGDAHLKNFGIIYDRVDQNARLAPVYDIVTTWPYVPNDPMALTLDGSTNWPDRRKLIRLGQTRTELTLAQIERILEAVADAAAAEAAAMRRYFTDTAVETGERMLNAWETGLRETLALGRSLINAVMPSGEALSEPAQRMAKSDGLVLGLLRDKEDGWTGSKRALAEQLHIPPSTLNAAVKRLVERGFVKLGKRSLKLIEKKV